MSEANDSPACRQADEERTLGVVMIATIHLGESEDRMHRLCGADVAEVEDGYTNIDLDRVTWEEDGSWIDDVTCLECLRVAIKIGDDAKRRLEQIAAASRAS